VLSRLFGIRLIGLHRSTFESGGRLELTRDNNIPASRLTRRRGAYEFSKPGLEERRVGREALSWWSRELEIMELSRAVILVSDRNHTCWSNWLDRYKTEWEKAMITSEEGKQLFPDLGRLVPPPKVRPRCSSSLISHALLFNAGSTYGLQ
jgi:hypothetical protein